MYCRSGGAKNKRLYWSKILNPLIYSAFFLICRDVLPKVRIKIWFCLSEHLEMCPLKKKCRKFWCSQICFCSESEWRETFQNFSRDRNIYFRNIKNIFISSIIIWNKSPALYYAICKHHKPILTSIKMKRKSKQNLIKR